MIVLDTHALIWWVNDSAGLSSEALVCIEDARQQSQLFVSSISAWEVAMLVHRGRIAFSMGIFEWLHLVEQIEGLRFIPVDNDVALKSTLLPGEFHKDPADRMIVATAQHIGATIVSVDEKIRHYPHAKSIS